MVGILEPRELKRLMPPNDTEQLAREYRIGTGRPAARKRFCSKRLRALLQFRPYPDCECSQSIDRAFDRITRRHRPYAGGRTGKNDVTWAQFILTRELGDDFWHIPDHLADIALLPNCPVDRQADCSLTDGAGGLDPVNGPARR